MKGDEIKESADAGGGLGIETQEGTKRRKDAKNKAEGGG